MSQMRQWLENWHAVTGRTGETRADGSERRYFPSVHFGGACPHDRGGKGIPSCVHTDVIHVNGSLDECEAAAQFIAAAPAVYFALREWMDSPPACVVVKTRQAPTPGCDCWICTRVREAARVLGMADGRGCVYGEHPMQARCPTAPEDGMPCEPGPED